MVSSLREIKDIGIETCSAIVDGNLRRFGELMDIHWQTKKRLAEGITNPQIDAWYELAKRHGAIGGKISGAGGGGFLTLYCEEHVSQVREAMRAAGLRQLNFRFDFEGSKVIFDVVSRDGRLAHIQRQNHRERGSGGGRRIRGMGRLVTLDSPLSTNNRNCFAKNNLSVDAGANGFFWVACWTAG